jgi:large subunit ribosomal protein L10
MNREQKQATIESIADQLSAAGAVIAVDHSGLDVAATEALRRKLREGEARLRVVKNTLTERAADQAGVAELKEVLQGPTALAFAFGDPVAAAKAIAEQQKATGKLPFKGGVLGGRLLRPEELDRLAKLPGREVLYGQLVGIVAHPLSGLARTLNGLLSGLAVALNQVKEQKAAAGGGG